jgi:hypothetical protein
MSPRAQQTKPSTPREKRPLRTIMTQRGGESHHPPMKTSPTSKRNPKNAPPQSDSAQKCAAKQRIRHINPSQRVQRRPPRDSRLAQGQPRAAPLRPGSRERRTPRLRSLPPGPGQIRPANGPAPPYEGGGTRPPAPRGGPSTGPDATYSQTTPAHPEVTDPSYSPYGGEGQG